ncbi:hypothetical protein BU17DRAFT_102476 [Hysterangium stoloniferum]|nr:hypothetical protein BU17DRAFT_102476 [Hysterangium stoloniferum]
MGDDDYYTQDQWQDNKGHSSQGQWYQHQCHSRNGEVPPEYPFRAGPFMSYDTQDIGGMNHHMQACNSHPLTSYPLPASPEIAYGQYWSAGCASPTASEITHVSYPDDNPYVGLFDVPSDCSYDPGCFRAASNPVVHQTWRVDTGEEEATRRYFHRVTDTEKRRMQLPLARRPMFVCRIPNCSAWLFNRGQVKQHLQDHNIMFRKPFKCTCGSEFGRSVEADRHVEDKRPCDVCHRSGRKTKNSLTCRRCCP